MTTEIAGTAALLGDATGDATVDASEGDVAPVLTTLASLHRRYGGRVKGRSRLLVAQSRS